jgi:cobalt-zinc-cadmium efflux system outer membrane protein
MSLLYLCALLMAASIGVTGCAIPHVGGLAPEPRPLGQNVPAFQAPQEPPAIPSYGLQPEEPTGVLTLRQALALALLRNPELASAAWEVRAGEARTLQAGLCPTPNLRWKWRISLVW